MGYMKDLCVRRNEVIRQMYATEDLTVSELSIIFNRPVEDIISIVKDM